MKKIISILLTVLIFATAIAACAITAGAVTYVTFGDYKLAVYSDTEYLIGGYSGSDTALTFPDSANGKAIIGVAEDFYDKCSASLVSVTMPESFTVIESFAFYGMTALEEVTLSPNISSIGSMAFSGCGSLADINLSDTKVTSVSYACFSGCQALNNIAFPDGLKAVGEYAFSNSGLKSAVLPDSAASIGAYAFNGCAALEDVELPYGLTSIGEHAFYNDTALTSVYVPGSVSQIGAFAFNPMGIEGGTLTLECYEGTYAAEYAYDNYLNCATLGKLLGDTDCSGVVNIDDVTYIQLYKVELNDLSVKEKELADVNKDGEVALRDATLIQMYLAGLITEF